jgi:hypothetical protein
MIKPVCTILSSLILLACASCDRASSASATPVYPKSVPGNGVIRGSIKFVGAAPVMKTIAATEACCKTDPPIAEQSVIVNPNGTLRNVFVYLEGAPRLDGSDVPPALLDQEHCVFVPHAMGVQLGQVLRLRSSDPTMHNVHAIPSVNNARNYALTAAGMEVNTKFTQGAEIVRMKCDVHPWMTAWVGVFENPFFAVTQENGSYQIKGIPAGTYKLVAWHELYGRQEQTVTVADSGGDVAAAEVDFTFGRSQG